MKARFFTASWKTALLAGAAIGCFMQPQIALAQSEAEADAADDDEIILVLARKNTETLQEVPVTVTALGGDLIAKDQTTKLEQIGNRVPTLSVQPGGSGSGGSIALRGVGSSAISAAFDSAVALDIDGIQLSSMRLVQAGFFDVQQIDVLKGPQSLFFGKSASAGVVSLRSNDPTPEWQFGGKASYEFEEKGYVVGGFISGPITDTLGIRIAAQYNDIEKYVEIQPGFPVVKPNRGLKDFVGRLTLNWNPTDRFTANFKLNYITNKNDGAIAHQDIDCGANGRADEVILLGGAIAVPSGANCNTRDNFFAIGDPSATQNSNYPTGSAAGDGRYPGRPFGDTEIWLARLRFDLDLSDTLKLTSVTGYFDLDSVDSDTYSSVGVGPAFNPNGVPVAAIAPRLAAVNLPGSSQGFGSSDPRNTTEQYTQELRLSSDFEGPFNFNVGAFYEDRDINFNTSQQGVNISIIALDPITGSAFDWYKKHRTRTTAVSLFGSGIFDITDRLELSGGLRWTKEKKVNTISVPYVHLFLSSGPAFIDSGFFSGPIEFKDTNFSPEVALRYEVTDDVSVYAAYKTGYKSGGIDNSALPSSNLLGLDNPATRDAVANGLIYKSETAKGGEVGVKTQFAGRSITLNTSAFYYVFSDLQLQVFNAATIQFRTFNASELTTKGFDVDFSWRTPLDGLRILGALAYTDAKFTKSLPSEIFAGVDLEGRAAARAPKWAGNIGFDWGVPISDAIELGLNGNFQFSSSYFTTTTSFTDLKQKAYATIDGGISIGHPDGNWKLSLVGINVTDKIYATTSGGRPFLAGTPLGVPGSPTFVPVGDDLNVNYNRGRQIFVEASFRF
jgi:iron complex outermembrane receptor protein